MKSLIVAAVLSSALIPPIALHYTAARGATNVATAHQHLANTFAGINAYVSDHGTIPPMAQHLFLTFAYPSQLTSPIAYCTQEDTTDPFKPPQPANQWTIGLGDHVKELNYFDLRTGGLSGDLINLIWDEGLVIQPRMDFLRPQTLQYRLLSYGPDMTYGPAMGTVSGNLPVTYDPTNGLTSRGDIMKDQFRFGDWQAPHSTWSVQ